MSKIIFDTENMELTPDEMERMIGNLRAFLEKERDIVLEKERKETRAKELEAEIIELRGNLAAAAAEYVSAIIEKNEGERIPVEVCDRIHTDIYNTLKIMEDSSKLSIVKPISIDFTDLFKNEKSEDEKPNVNKSAQIKATLSDDESLKRFLELFGV